MSNPNFKNYYSPDQSIRFTMTTPDEEHELFVKAKEHGCEKSRTFLITNYLLFAKTYAESCVRNNALGRDEVISAANMALVTAFESFDHTRGFRFSTYARPFIRGEIAELWKSKFLGTVPDPSICSGQFAATENSNREIETTQSHGAEELDLREFNRDKLAEALAALPPRDAELIRLRYVEDLSFADIARLRKVSREAVRAAHGHIVVFLRRQLEKKGVNELE